MFLRGVYSSEKLGIFLPEQFLEFVNAVDEIFSSDEDEIRSFLNCVFFFRPNPECRYQTTPIEFVPFGDLGVDGAHFGFVVHAPELKPKDFLIGVYNPLDQTEVNLVGENTFDFLERRIANVHRYWYEHKQKEDYLGDKTRFEQKLDKLINKLDLKPVRQLAIDGDGWCKEGVQPNTIPKDWNYVSGSDGIGVLAPKHLFHPDPTSFKAVPGWVKTSEIKGSRFEGNEDVAIARPSTLIASARQYMEEGFPASALHCLRESAWFNNGDEVGRKLNAEMAIVYDALQRPELASFARRRANGEF